MSDELSQRPDFGPPETLPWEPIPDSWRTPWPWGNDRGQPLWTLDSKQLVEKVEWCVERNVAAELVAIMEDILHARQGE